MLGDRELGAGVVLGAQHPRVVRPGTRRVGWPSGKAATPTAKSPGASPARPARWRRSSPPSVGIHGGAAARPGGRRAGRARCGRRPRRRSSRIAASSSRVWPTQVRWPIGSSEVSRAIRPVMPTVVSRVVPPAPYVTETNVGCRARGRGSPARAAPRRPRPWAGRTRTRTSARRSRMSWPMVARGSVHARESR